MTDGMIQNGTVGAELVLAWESVREDRNVIVGNLNSLTMAGRPASSAFRDLCFNLLLARAFSVLEEALEQLRLEGRFATKSRRLKDLMAASRQSVPWRSFDAVDKARERRNETIHDRVRLPHAECRDFLAIIEQELAAWDILPEIRRFDRGKPR